jgi:glycosyltransferase involved in cell wall biosynthesis
MSTLSTILITRNEKTNLDRCLRSVDWSDEIIVVDSGSTDGTREIALSHGAQFFHEDWKGYTEQKNSALGKATQEWVLSIDADEELTPQAQQKIKDILREDDRTIDGYYFRRKVFYLGKWITHGDWYPDNVLRLWRRGFGRFAGGQVHESVQVAKTAKLREEILHYTYKDVEDQKRRMETYARLWAEDRKQEGCRATLADRLLRPPWRFFRGLLLKGGFLDGWRGVLIAWYCARETAMKYKYLAVANRVLSSNPESEIVNPQ